MLAPVGSAGGTADTTQEKASVTFSPDAPEELWDEMLLVSQKLMIVNDLIEELLLSVGDLSPSERGNILNEISDLMAARLTLTSALKHPTAKSLNQAIHVVNAALLDDGRSELNDLSEDPEPTPTQRYQAAKSQPAATATASQPHDTDAYFIAPLENMNEALQQGEIVALLEQLEQDQDIPQAIQDQMLLTAFAALTEEQQATLAPMLGDDISVDTLRQRLDYYEQEGLLGDERVQQAVDACMQCSKDDEELEEIEEQIATMAAMRMNLNLAQQMMQQVMAQKAAMQQHSTPTTSHVHDAQHLGIAVEAQLEQLEPSRH